MSAIEKGELLCCALTTLKYEMAPILTTEQIQQIERTTIPAMIVRRELEGRFTNIYSTNNKGGFELKAAVLMSLSRQGFPGLYWMLM